MKEAVLSTEVDLGSLSDDRLMEAIARGNSGALGILYDRYGRLVFSLAVNIINDDAVAEEVTQEVFFQVWNKAATYHQEQSKVSTWLTSVARHKAIDIFRQRNVRPEGHQIGWEDEDMPDVPDDLVIEVSVEQNIDQQRVRRAIATLPAEQREALGLAFFKGYSHQEIANETGEPLGTIKTRVKLAMQKIRQALLID
jgi:RNA polymerase sigma-70 factor, ECF subfamily